MPVPRGGPANSKKKNSALVAEEQIRCYQLRLTGATLQMIANQTGLPLTTVHERINREIKGRVLPDAEQVRQMQVDRMDEWLMHLNRQIREGRAVARNIEICLRVEERRAKLLGVDAPERTTSEVTYTPSTDLEQRVAAARALLDAGGGGG